MKNEILSDLKPTEFFHWFEVVSKIPRGSGNEQGMIDFLRQFADERELSWDVDAAGNVLMTVPA
ncbi:MAG: aminoacyl-histidine dipeptidase, partial [Eubacteriales bacterium]|nr:aminoacyl-histidine dipeptidase [Eubacteriales bacterium]